MDSIAGLSVSAFLEQLAAKTPAPGGGAAAAMTGATAASLAGMVIAYSSAKKSLAPHRPALEAAGHRTGEIASRFVRLADEDAEAYSTLNAIRRLPEGDADRVRDEPAAAARATAVPRRALDLSCDLLDLLESLVSMTSPGLRSDLAIAAVLAEAAASSAAWNVWINAPLVPEAERTPLIGRAKTAVRRAREARDRVEKACQ